MNPGERPGAGGIMLNLSGEAGVVCKAGSLV